jgi:hypothetical protein
MAESHPTRNQIASWIAGYAAARGSFVLAKVSSDPDIPMFVVAPKDGDIAILERILDFFGCGFIVRHPEKPIYVVADIDDLKETIVPFFDEERIMRSKDFPEWRRVVMEDY